MDLRARGLMGQRAAPGTRGRSWAPPLAVDGVRRGCYIAGSGALNGPGPWISRFLTESFFTTPDAPSDWGTSPVCLVLGAIRWQPF